MNYRNEYQKDFRHVKLDEMVGLVEAALKLPLKSMRISISISISTPRPTLVGS